MSGTTSVQITREASNLLDHTAKASGLAKSYLADIAIKYFFDNNFNPDLEEALRGLSSGRKQAEQDFVAKVFRVRAAQ